MMCLNDHKIEICLLETSMYLNDHDIGICLLKDLQGLQLQFTSKISQTPILQIFNILVQFFVAELYPEFIIGDCMLKKIHYWEVFPNKKNKLTFSVIQNNKKVIFTIDSSSQIKCTMSSEVRQG